MKRNVNPFELAQNGADEGVPLVIQEGIKALDNGAMKRFRRTNDGWQAGPFLLRSIGLETSGDVTRDQWKELGEHLASWGSGLQVWLGDWAYYANHYWDMSYEQISEAIDGQYAPGTLRNLASTMSRIPLSLRSDKLTINHYHALAKIEDEQSRLEWAEWVTSQEKVPSYRKLEEEIFGKSISEVSATKRELADAFSDLKRYAEDLGVAPRDVLAIAANIAATGTPDGETPLTAALTEEAYERTMRHREYIHSGSRFEPIARHEITAQELISSPEAIYTRFAGKINGWLGDADVDPDEVLIVTIARIKDE